MNNDWTCQLDFSDCAYTKIGKQIDQKNHRTLGDGETFERFTFFTNTMRGYINFMKTSDK